jgi:hypothetical protein
VEPQRAPTCIGCGRPLSGHDPACPHVQTSVADGPFEDGNARIAAMSTIFEGRKNSRWEIWDLDERRLVAEYESETAAKTEIARLVALSDHVRYVMLLPHNIVHLDAYRRPEGDDA